MPADTMRFPPDFRWGAAISANQTEGAASEDGRGESIWNRFSATPGRVRSGDTNAVACDFYHRYPGDIELMRDLGIDALRCSIAWPRVLPEGSGRVNEAGLDFYDRLVDALLEQGIEPFVTLYFWDLPQALEDAGGWLSRDTVQAFADFTEIVVGRLGDRVARWTTHNEPFVAAWFGYGWGQHAPGRFGGEAGALAAAHHLLVSHGRAVEILRSEIPTADVGITLNLYHVEPASERQEDLDAARWADGCQNRWFLDPIFRGEYPADMLERFGAAIPPLEDGDLERIAAPIDFLGVNYYSRYVVAAGQEVTILREACSLPDIDGRQPELTDMGWEVYPDGLYKVLVRVRDDYAPQRIYITENGAAYSDVRRHDGSVPDPERVAFVERHLDAVARAIEHGVPVAGYFLWSLLDNFELAFGYAKRFGIVYVDYPTLARVPKASFHWYRDFIAAQRNEEA